MNNIDIQQNIQLLPYNSFQTAAVAKFFAEPTSLDELLSVLEQFKNEQILILGNGCNLFFTQSFDGLVIKLNLKGKKVVAETLSTVDLEVQASEDWDTLVQFCVDKSLAGIENLSLIPGTVGAAPIQNIGAYGTEVKDVITQVNAIDLETLKIESFTKEMCQFAYRNSLFKQTRRYVITSVVFRLQKQFVYQPKYIDVINELKDVATPALAQVREAIITIRTRKLPDHKILPNAGSFFKNPIITDVEEAKLLALLPDAPIYPFGDKLKTSAAYLIDRAGLKGYRKDNVGTYEKQPLIVVNYGTKSGRKIANFIQEIQRIVEQKFFIRLEPEVWIF